MIAELNENHAQCDPDTDSPSVDQDLVIRYAARLDGIGLPQDVFCPVPVCQRAAGQRRALRVW